MKKAPIRLKEFAAPLPYQEALALMRSLHAERVAGKREDTLLLLEHPAVITLGANADAAGILTPDETLQNLGIEVARVERGGQATLHLPGQLVAYPLLHLRERALGVRAYVSALEDTLIATASAFGLEASTRPGAPGVYLPSGKLAALGVAVKGGVTLHGVALNVSCDLTLFRHIVPCGQTDTPPQSLAKALDAPVPFARAREAFLRSFSQIFGEIIA